ncbi:N,N-dimethylformamidase beta subunit family domain-containing protein [Pseudofrankia inefficax]|uniref:N,N-dimethylformamidase beta subunit-like C-terminal domain-containing protein n=1 Tax=Pseudofrankia inefficax (strain DSM 45817 / CECT 9037 / DDB 130130 / EuI1c) TaxID=298654 RepID=E3IZS5_PSEI1|nr:N,N-dimethylformamidase beta subunit family domain-containing protein [Pseudofrankia inefficax]ADP83993.1 hypothetical protein FraEuI1c_6009 [Pseudofrankia inefficax]
MVAWPRRAGPAAALTAVILVVLIVVAWLVWPTGSTGTPSAGGSSPPTTSGADGVVSRAIVAENARPGTTAWQISAPDPTGIEGFTDRVSAAPGATVRLFVSTQESRFHIEAYRMGYYRGTGARLVWRSAQLPGRRQATCPVAAHVNMVSCAGWTPTMTVRISPDFVPGDYLLKLVGTSAGAQSYVPLTVVDPASRAAYLVKNDVYTWQAWNPYGGYDFYTGIGSCPAGGYPLCSRARTVSFDRPYGYGQGAGDFLSNEYPLIRFAEQRGLDVTYATDTDVEHDPALVTRHRALLSLGHDECWSLGEREAAMNAARQGVNIAFFAASPVLRHVRLEPSALGPSRQEVDYRNSSDDPLDGHGDPRQVTGNTWSSPPANWSEVPFVGEAYAGYIEPGQPAAPLIIGPSSTWIYRGLRLPPGTAVPNALGSDFDQFDPGSHPANLEILAHSPIPRNGTQTSRAAPYSDMTYYTDPASDAGVFDSGINSWIPDLTPCPPGTQAAACPATTVSTMTANLFALFGRGPAGHYQPSQANWSQYYP